MKKEILELNNISKKFGNKLSLDIEKLNIKRGSFHGLVGSNGAGKTTLIKSIIGAYVPDTGTIKFNSKGNRSLSDSVCYVAERPLFKQSETIITYLNRIRLLNSISEEVFIEKTKLLLKKFEIYKFRFNKTILLSSGMQKKVMIISAILADPEMMILDEPVANVDPKSRKEIFNILRDLNKNGVTIIISSHILSELEKHIQEITVLDFGRLVFSGTVKKYRKNDFHYILTLNKKMKFNEQNSKILNIKKDELDNIINIIKEKNLKIVDVKNKDMELS